MAESKKTGTYEAMFLFPAGAAAELEASMKTARGIIERHGGQIIVLKKWDERKLAYEIGKHKRGLYVIAYFTAPGGAIGAMERDAKLSEDIVRILVTRADHLTEAEMNAVEPQPIVPREPRESFDDRGGYGGGFGGGGYGRRGGGGGGDRDRDRGGDRGGDRAGDRGPRPAAAPAGGGGAPAEAGAAKD